MLAQCAPTGDDNDLECARRKPVPTGLSRWAGLTLNQMADGESKSWLRGRVEKAVIKGLTRAYSTVEVDPGKFLLQLRTAYRLPISGYHGVYSLEVGELDVVADGIIRSGMKLAAVEGAGFGLGGLITIFPDLGILSAITMRTIQKLSLVYGFQFNTDNEIAELWIAAASAAGVEHQPRTAGERSGQQVCSASDSAHRRPGERRSGGEMGGANDPAGQFGARRRVELLVCARVGSASQSAFPRAPSATAPTGTASRCGASGGPSAACFDTLA